VIPFQLGTITWRQLRYHGYANALLVIIQKTKLVGKLAEELTATLFKCFISLTYNCTEEQEMSLRETNSELTRLMTKFKASLPNEEGFLVCPEVRKHLKRVQQKKWAANTASQNNIFETV